MSLADLPYLADVAKARTGPIEKGPTRLEQSMDARPLIRIDEQAFRKTVIDRDGYFCRCCGRKVIKTLARVAERLEVHHIHGRTGDLRFEDRAALVTCCACHERLTGRVNQHRMVIIPTKTFETRQGVFSDARYPVVFKESA
jgi:hypothetical protein